MLKSARWLLMTADVWWRRSKIGIAYNLQLEEFFSREWNAAEESAVGGAVKLRVGLGG